MDTPTAVLPGTPTTSREELKNWLLSNKLPGYLELTQDTFQTVMNAPHNPLVVIATSNDKLEAKIEAKIIEISKDWREKSGGTGTVGGREVIFTWMDGERWRDWMKSMYSIGIDDDEDDMSDVKVVVANHKVRLPAISHDSLLTYCVRQDLVYYDQDPSGQTFKLTAPDRLFKSLQAITSGTLGYKHCENTIERLARALNNRITAFEAYVVEYPFRFVFFLIVGMGALFYALYKWVGSDVAGLERGDHLTKSKGGRLD